MPRKNKKTIKKQIAPVERMESVEEYLAKDNFTLAPHLSAMTINLADEMDDRLIKAAFDFKNARYQHGDEDRTVNRLVSYAIGMSGAISRLKMLMEWATNRLGDKYTGGVGSTGSARGDFEKLLELTASAAYTVGILQGAKLEGASTERLEHIASFAKL